MTAFHALFGAAPEATASAPGRVNLIGEHTDYHQGFVLPTVLPHRTVVALRRRPDDLVRAWSAGVTHTPVEYRIGSEARRRDWLDYVQGITAALRRRGVAISGFDVRVESTVPIGSGVSSSAALEIAVLRAIRLAFALALDDVGLARIGQAVENDFVGAPVGIMDQMVCSVGGDGEALFLDTLAFERIPLPSSIELIVIDSGVAHRHAGGEYVARRRESFAAAALLGVDYLRDVEVTDMPRIAALPTTLCRRARHVVTENQRVLDAVAALRAADAVRLGELFHASHRSMRDDYETSTPDIDTLAALGQQHADVHGARLTGGGFGGAVVMLARAGTGRDAARAIRGEYHAATKQAATVLVPGEWGMS